MNQKPNIPVWAGRYPFEPGNKKPALLTSTRMPRLYGTGRYKVPTCLYVSTDKITSSGFSELPGGWFEPADIHGGAEVYYVRRGTASALDPETGRVLTIKSGEMLYIPQEVWHQTYNFTDEPLDVITFFAPRMWFDAMGVEVTYLGGENLFDGSLKEGKTYPKPVADNILVLDPPEYGVLGRYPISAEYALSALYMFVMRPDTAMNLIRTGENRSLVKIFVSNSIMTAGTITLPPGTETSLESHPGDEIFCTFDDGVSIVIYEEGTPAKAVSVPRYEVPSGERFLIPEGTRHSYYNPSDKTITALFVTAPGL